MDKSKLFVDAANDQVIRELWNTRKQLYKNSKTLDVCIHNAISDEEIKEFSELELLDYIKYNLFIDVVSTNAFHKMDKYTFKATTVDGPAQFVAYRMELDLGWPEISFKEIDVAPGTTPAIFEIKVCGYSLHEDKWKQWYSNPGRTFMDMPIYIRYGNGPGKKVKELLVKEFTAAQLAIFIEDNVRP